MPKELFRTWAHAELLDQFNKLVHELGLTREAALDQAMREWVEKRSREQADGRGNLSLRSNSRELSNT